jgi:uncharacterized spore protein YtfJ
MAGVPRRRTDEMLAMLAERVGGRFNAATVFGEPVERDGVTVIPVATSRFGFGGGGGDPDEEQSGEGGGGGGTAAAAGYIEIKGGRTRFVPIVHPTRMVALVLAFVLGVLAVTRAAEPRPGRRGRRSRRDRHRP